MASVNKFIGIGNCGRDPETKHLPDGGAITNISIACTEKFKNKSGSLEERTEWIKVVFFGKLAEIAAEYIVKGSSVYVEGRLQTRKWKNKDGVDQYSTEVVAEKMQMLSKRDAGHSEKKEQSDNMNHQKPYQDSIQDMEDDIPF